MLAALLSGGQNTRYPTPKGLITLEGGQTILGRSLGILGSVAGTVVISTNTPELYFSFGVPMIGDTVASAGPLSGIVSVMDAFAGEEEVLVAACDMPFLSEEVVKLLVELKGRRATVPVVGGRTEPLLALYTREAVQVMKALISEGKTSIARALEDMGDENVRYVSEEEIRRVDPECRSFMNINTPEDYNRALGAISARR